MVKNTFRETSDKLLSSTEKQALAKLKKVHEPMLKELEKWKDQREKLETALLEQIERIGKFLEPYQDPARIQQTLRGLAGQQPRATSSKKKTTTSKKSAAPKRSVKQPSKPTSRTAKKSR